MKRVKGNTYYFFHSRENILITLKDYIYDTKWGLQFVTMNPTCLHDHLIDTRVLTAKLVREMLS